MKTDNTAARSCPRQIAQWVAETPAPVAVVAAHEVAGHVLRPRAPARATAAVPASVAPRALCPPILALGDVTVSSRSAEPTPLDSPRFRRLVTQGDAVSSTFGPLDDALRLTESPQVPAIARQGLRHMYEQDWQFLFEKPGTPTPISRPVSPRVTDDLLRSRICGGLLRAIKNLSQIPRLNTSGHVLVDQVRSLHLANVAVLRKAALLMAAHKNGYRNDQEIIDTKYTQKYIPLMEKISCLGPTNINFLDLQVNLNIDLEGLEIKRRRRRVLHVVSVFDKQFPHEQLTSVKKRVYLGFLPHEVRPTFPAHRGDWSFGALLMHAASAGQVVYDSTCAAIKEALFPTHFKNENKEGRTGFHVVQVGFAKVLEQRDAAEQDWREYESDNAPPVRATASSTRRLGKRSVGRAEELSSQPAPKRPRNVGYCGGSDQSSVSVKMPLSPSLQNEVEALTQWVAALPLPNSTASAVHSNPINTDVIAAFNAMFGGATDPATPSINHLPQELQGEVLVALAQRVGQWPASPTKELATLSVYVALHPLGLAHHASALRLPCKVGETRFKNIQKLLAIHPDHLVEMFEKDLLLMDLGVLLLNPDNEQRLKTASAQPEAVSEWSADDKKWLAVLQDIAKLIDVVKFRRGS
jgi:hypothetical protein